MKTLATALPLACMLGSLSATVHAADRALLIGVGEYANPKNNLHGIDLDIDNMERAAMLLGFKPENIMTLEDSRATQRNIVDAMQTWLVEGVGPNDRVLFYFSGHGTQFRDSDGNEPDGFDELLVPHDARVEEQDGKGVWKGYLIDDDIDYLLGLIPSRNMMVFIDACHSGTATRTLTADPAYFGVSEVYPKFEHHDSLGTIVAGEPTVAASLRTLAGKATEGSGYVAITAARDDQTAIATPNGGAFTLGLVEAIREGLRTNVPLTPAYLRDYTDRYITRILSPDKRHQPQLSGDTARFAQPLPTASLAAGAAATPGTVWTSLVTSADEYARAHGTLTVTTNAGQYRLGQEVEITINVPAGGGYLNVVTVDSKDQSTVLFPNQFHEDNRVTAGSVRIPTAQMSFTLPASEPLGDTLVIAFLSSTPVNLYETQVGGQRDAKGDYTEVFAEVSAPGMRAISVAGKAQQGVRAGKLVVSTVR